MWNQNIQRNSCRSSQRSKHLQNIPIITLYIESSSWFPWLLNYQRTIFGIYMRKGEQSEQHVRGSWVISQGMKRMMRPLRVSGVKGILIVSTLDSYRMVLMADNSISLLYSQPISALQILTPQGEWKWVKHVEGSVVVNTADALECKPNLTYTANISPNRRDIQSDPT